jgi:long-chain-fatty-acid--CoA ligase ACSBG
MLGYMKDVAKTCEAIDSEGFLHSGDVGAVDPQTGLLRITGRIKELIIGAGGENIAPVPVEDKLKAEMPALSNVMMVTRAYCITSQVGI